MSLSHLQDDQKMVEMAVAYKAKECGIRLSIPQENIRSGAFQDLYRDQLLVHIGLMMAGVQDKTQTVTKTDIVGFVPSSIGDWFRKRIKDFLVKHGLYKLAGRFGYNQIAITTNNVTEHWNVCPHTLIQSGRDGCVRFMRFGSDFRDLNKEARVAAQQIVKAVIEDVERPYSVYPSISLLRAIRDYKEATGCR